MKFKTELKGLKFEYIAKIQTESVAALGSIVALEVSDPSSSRRGAGSGRESPNGSAMKRL
jgi:hypothetical protein